MRETVREVHERDTQTTYMMPLKAFLRQNARANLRNKEMLSPQINDCEKAYPQKQRTYFAIAPVKQVERCLNYS